MFIEFKQKELKKNQIEVSQLTFCYLLAIRNDNPIVFEQLKRLIKQVEEKESK